VIAVGLADGPVALLAALAFLAGAATPPVKAVLRNVWRVLIGDDAKVQSAFALQVMLGEIAYFSGPLLAAAALALGSPAAALVVAAVLSAGGTLAFVRAPAIADYAAPPPKGGGKGALAHRGVRTVVLTTGLFGATFGILDVAVAGFATSHHQRAMAGVALGALSVGVAGGSYLWGRRAQQGPAGTHYVALSALAAVPLGIACLAPTPLALAGLLILVGAGFAPIAAVQLAIMDEVAPPHARTEAGSWAGAAYGALSAVGALLAGLLVDSPGARTALLAACAATTLATLIALARRATLRPLQPV
jgi:hypothetical protein